MKYAVGICPLYRSSYCYIQLLQGIVTSSLFRKYYELDAIHDVLTWHISSDSTATVLVCNISIQKFPFGSGQTALLQPSRPQHYARD